ncbi:hypothetical protein RSOLAG22IIIB_07231 [Rhizoctonia solani]|uniref:Uncharacterized protein n=1 Tax=Rhizoctonia solani TaxID=456999 RepID=A0A0K6FLX0_9AGAM|nr:hypothetical protein RSOLAG22IIIB_07231 [Rhizoctonia solani]
MSFGAEAIAQQARENAEDNDWTLAKRFKLHLHPPEMRAKHSIKLEHFKLGQILLCATQGYVLSFSDQVKSDTMVQKNRQILPCATQGSTVDTTIYSIVETRPFLELAEKRDSACVQAGGLYVDDAVERYLEDILTRAGMNAEDIKESLTNADINVRRGVMTIQNPTPKRFFDYCVKAIIKSLDDQVKGANVSHILLVGGFGDSPFLQSQLREHFQPGIQLTTANDYTSKAVAEGAIMWNTMTSVFTRAPNWSYGIQGYVRFDSYSSDHRERTTFTTPDGYEKVNGVWCEIVKKGVPLNVNAVCRQSFFRTYSTPHPNLESIEIALFSYSGNDQPKWLRSKGGSLLRGFENVCLITADLRSLGGALEAKIGPRGTYWGLLFWVCVRFGDTEISAYLEWEEAGETRTGPISIIPQEVSWA